MTRAAAVVLCVCTVLCSVITSVRCGNLSPCMDEEWTVLDQTIANSGCAEKIVGHNLLDLLRGNHAFEDILEQNVHLCKVFVRLTSMLVSKYRLSDLCVTGVVDHETAPLLCAKTTDLVHLVTALQKKDDPVLSATAEVLQKLEEEATCEITCTPGLGAALCNGIVKSARNVLTLTTTQKSLGSSRKLLSDDNDLRSAFDKNLPVTNEQIDAFNRGERQYINEQLMLLTLTHQDIQQEVEKASLGLTEDEDYRIFMQRGPPPSQLPAAKGSGSFYAIAVVMVVVLAIIAYCIVRWKTQHSGQVPQQRKLY